MTHYPRSFEEATRESAVNDADLVVVPEVAAELVETEKGVEDASLEHAEDVEVPETADETVEPETGTAV